MWATSMNLKVYGLDSFEDEVMAHKNTSMCPLRIKYIYTLESCILQNWNI